jgi:hypothetical protein
VRHVAPANDASHNQWTFEPVAVTEQPPSSLELEGAGLGVGVVGAGVVGAGAVGAGAVDVGCGFTVAGGGGTGGVVGTGTASAGKTAGSLGSPSGLSSSKSAIVSPSLSRFDVWRTVSASYNVVTSLPTRPRLIIVTPNGWVAVPKPPARLL